MEKVRARSRQAGAFQGEYVLFSFAALTSSRPRLSAIVQASLRVRRQHVPGQGVSWSVTHDPVEGARIAHNVRTAAAGGIRYKTFFSDSLLPLQRRPSPGPSPPRDRGGLEPGQLLPDPAGADYRLPGFLLFFLSKMLICKYFYLSFLYSFPFLSGGDKMLK